MFQVLTIALRDVRSYLYSFSFYLVLVFFAAISGYFFWSAMGYFSLLSFQAAASSGEMPMSLNLMERVFSPFLLNVSVLMLLLIPILTMRSFSEERKLGTLELLVTYPVTDLQIVLGKFLANLLLSVILILPTVFYFFLARSAQAHFEMASVAMGYLGLFLVASSFIALSIFISSLTDHQAVSAGVGFALLLFFWIVGWVADWTQPQIGNIFRELSLIEHFRDLTRGILDSTDLVYFLLFIGFFLFATVASLEVRTWKR